MNKITTYLLLFLLCLVTNQIVAQNSQLRPYTIEDGLPQSQVYAIVQDETGYLWLGTQGGGLANFDGSKFTVWNEADGLLSNYIHSLYSKNDTLFIGSKRGLSIKVKERISNFEGPQIEQFYSKGSSLYVATEKGVYRFSIAAGLKKITINPEIDNSAINEIHFKDSFFWLATNNGLWKLTELNNSASSISKLETNNFISLVFHEDTVFAATFNDGILVLDANAPDTTILIREPLRINSMSLQNKNELWVATDNEGITILNTENYAKIKKIDTRNGLSVPHVRKVKKDKDSNIWIATSGGGFYKYFQNNFKHFDAASGLKGDRTYAVHKAKDGVWISSSEAGLTRIDSMGIHLVAQTKEFEGIKIKTIASDAKGAIWAGSDGMGILFREIKKVYSVVTRVNDSLKVARDTVTILRVKNHILNRDNGFPDDWIRKIIVKDDTIWAATYASGIVKFNYYSDSDSLVIRKIFGKRDGISDVFLMDMTTDAQGRIWYATKNRAIGFIASDTVTEFPSVLDGQTSIGTLIFHKNQLFIGTAGRGIWYSEANDSPTFQKLKGTKALSSENSYQLIFDDQGYLWAGTERGVDKIELNEANEIVDVYHFGRNDGFLAMETCLNAVDKDAAGNLWFGGIYGLTQYSPSETNLAVAKPEVRFTAIEVDYQVLDSILPNNWANNKKVLELNPEQTQLAFSYKTVDINHPNDVQYRTKRNGMGAMVNGEPSELDWPSVRFASVLGAVKKLPLARERPNRIRLFY